LERRFGNGLCPIVALPTISATMIVRRNITRAVQKKFFAPMADSFCG
jgi:hypothetical protein